MAAAAVHRSMPEAGGRGEVADGLGLGVGDGDGDGDGSGELEAVGEGGREGIATGTAWVSHCMSQSTAGKGPSAAGRHPLAATPERQW